MARPCENGPSAALLPIATGPARHRRPGCANPAIRPGRWQATTASTLLPAKYSYGANPYAYATMLITEGSSERLAEPSY